MKLLEERDAELENFEQSLIATRKQVADKNAEISDLKIKLDEFKKHFEGEKNLLDECKKHYLNRLNQKQNEIDRYKAYYKYIFIHIFGSIMLIRILFEGLKIMK